MSLPLKKIETGEVYYYSNIRRKKQKKIKKNPFVVLISLLLLASYGYWVCPYNYNNYLKPLFINRFLNRNIKLDTKYIANPTLPFVHNSYILNDYVLTPKVLQSKELTDIDIVYELSDTKNKIIDLAKDYPKLKPSIYVWEYNKSAGFEINSDEVYPAASIIKLPIACAFMRMLDRTSKYENPVTLNTKMKYTEQFKAGGSGQLKTSKTDVDYTLNHLARIMITHSDNSATNMILYQIGGMLGFNREMRNLGLKITSMQNWLPDLEGTNKTTSGEIAKILYNIDNPRFINKKYKNVLKEYLVNTKNTHLLKENLPNDVIVLHKTGNIGTMLGDAGIIYTNNGKKYIAVIMVKRPFNDYAAKKFIQDASLIIFEDIKKI